jgi:SAM-dependent methyltransferase
MDDHSEAFAANRSLWNAMTPVNYRSEMYDVHGSIAGRNSLSQIELDLLGDVHGLEILHLQCHFGQDTLSLARMGARVTGLDLSDAAIAQAGQLARECDLEAGWICANVVDPQPALAGRFDVVFTSFGTIGWLPDLGPWARNIRTWLKTGGRFVFAEFHPVVWMFDNGFSRLEYSYFNKGPIVELQKGSYADREADLELPAHGWNHSLADVLSALLEEGLRVDRFLEIDGSPHDCFSNMVRGDDGLYRIRGMEGILPMVHGLTAIRV